MSITVQSFLLCNSVNIHERSRLADVLGVFDVVAVTQFPAVHKVCAVYCRLYVFDEPSCRVSIVVESPALDKTRLMAPTVFKPDLNGKIKFRCNISKIALPQEGIYTLQLRVNGETRSEYHLTAVQRRKAGQGEGSDEHR